ncbi:MAG: DUF885 domain-containing protein [Chloroflexota bacterium]
MTDLSSSLILPRPAAAPDAGPLDSTFYDHVEDRARALFHANPIIASYFGIHEEDARLGDPSIESVEDEIARDKAHLAAIEALNPDDLSAAVRFERDLELHNLRLQLFDADVVRNWHRRPSAAGDIGDAIFLVFARGSAPLAERLGNITERLEGVPAYLQASRSRAKGPAVSTWQETDLRNAEDLPYLFAEVRTAADDLLSQGELARLDRAIANAQSALEGWTGWLREGLERADDNWPLGSERYDELVRLRSFGDLDANAILEIGEEQLRRNHEGRRAAALEVDPNADEATVIDRLKNDHPDTFEEALDGYRDAMRRSRQYLIDHDIVTVPDDEEIAVIPTPEYLRSVMPFAAYFSPARFDADRRGLYVVTPAVDNDPNAMREHYWASISNTSIHEAYPGHHLQLHVANSHPSVTRMLTDAPEFVEGWGMYSEQMMREEGFDAGPEFRTAMYTDAVWRSCRIILDVKMHRGQISEDDATDFLIEHTAFETANARAEVRRYTYTPGYQLSYLLGKVLILGLREEEKRRLGADFSLKRFHDTLLRNGSLPISFHRRLLRGEG